MNCYLINSIIIQIYQIRNQIYNPIKIVFKIQQQGILHHKFYKEFNKKYTAKSNNYRPYARI